MERLSDAAGDAMSRSWIAVAFTVGIVLAASSAFAHEMRPSHLTLTPLKDSSSVAVVWQVAFAKGAPMPLKLKLPNRCKPLIQPNIRTTRTVRTERFHIGCGNALPETLEIAVENLDRTGTDVIVRTGKGIWVLTATAPSVVVPIADSATQATSPGVWAYFPMGFEHILAGIDHLLFVLGLLMLVGLNWRKLLATTSAFTVGHSITLTLAASNTVTFPTRAVEVIIALSILALALELIDDPEDTSLTHRYPWVFACICGFVHGLGFAGVLAEVGLPRDALLSGVLLFNLGVEAGQIAFIGLCIGLFYIARRYGEQHLDRLRWATACGMGGVAFWWLLDRSFPILAA